ncbi:periplasmic protein [compost metagenome]
MKKGILLSMVVGFMASTAMAAVGTSTVNSQADRILTEINADSSLSGAQNMSVEAEGGWVVLRGTVNSKEERVRAEQIANGTPGVKSVDNKIQIRRE